jgi:hypothetical protein
MKQTWSQGMSSTLRSHIEAMGGQLEVVPPFRMARSKSATLVTLGLPLQRDFKAAEA